MATAALLDGGALSPGAIHMQSLFVRVVLSPVAVIVISLAARAILDKLLALQPDMGLIAYLAQAQSLFDLTAAVTLAGVGAGVAVFAARRETDAQTLMRDALIWGLLVTGCAAVGLLALTPAVNLAFGREIAPAGLVGFLAVGGGFVYTVLGLFLALWTGRLQRGRMILLGLAQVAPVGFAVSGLLGPVTATLVFTVQFVTLLIIGVALGAPVVVRAWRARADAPSWRLSPLKRYIVAGLSIGIMSPVSIMWSRAELAHSLSWDEVSQLQALWRASEWVTGLGGSLIGLVYLPRMAAALDRTSFLREVEHTWKFLCIPGALAMGLLWMAQGFVIPLLYTEKFIMPAAASGLFLLGDALRLASWVPLHGLFATERTKAVAIGEWLSLPLFAALLTVLSVKSLVAAGACYAVTYAVYLAFNAWCVYRTPGRYRAAPMAADTPANA